MIKTPARRLVFLIAIAMSAFLLSCFVFCLISAYSRTNIALWPCQDNEYLREYKTEFGTYRYFYGQDWTSSSWNKPALKLRDLTPKYQAEIETLTEKFPTLKNCSLNINYPGCSVWKWIVEYPNYSALNEFKKNIEKDGENGYHLAVYFPTRLRETLFFRDAFLDYSLMELRGFKLFFVRVSGIAIYPEALWIFLAGINLLLFLFAFGVMEPLLLPFRKPIVYVKTGRFN